MRYSAIKSSIITQFNAPNGHRTVFYIEGAPGGGKSACARDALRELGFTKEAGNLVEMVASIHEPVDVNGVPRTDGDFTKWVPPEEFFRLRKGTGRKALLLEELADANVPMQNALCSVIYDRVAGQLELTDELFIVATGNRTTDKSGANRITTKLMGRVRRLEFTENLEEWVDWAYSNGLPQELIQFLRWREGLFCEFDPNRQVNPTPRTWEDASRVPLDMPRQILIDNVAGSVGAGPAQEYVTFTEIYHGLIPVEEIFKNPEKAPVPAAKDIAVRYAMLGAISRACTKDNFEKALTYIERFEQKAMTIMMVRDVYKHNRKEMDGCQALTKWLMANKEVIV